MLRLLAGILIVLGVLGGGGAALVVSAGGVEGLVTGFQGEAEGTAVFVQEVARGDLVRTVNAPGTIEPEHSVEIGAQVSARIIDIPVEELAEIEKGQVLVRLDAEDVLARLDAAKSSLAAEKASLDGALATLQLAEIELGRVRELYDSGDVAKSAFDTAEADYQLARSNVEVARMTIEASEARIAGLEKDLANTVIKSPMDGTVTRINSEVGEMVLGTANNVGTVVMEVADLSRMIMRARVDESGVALVRPGQQATVYVLAHGEHAFEGEVQLVRLHRQVHTDGSAYIEAEILVQTPGERRLGIGWNANADIQVETQHDVIKIPSQAVMDQRVEEIPREVLEASEHVDRAKTFTRMVYRAVNSEAVMTPVTIGASDLTHTVVLEGLEEGDRVITGPFRALMDIEHGDPITIEAAPGVVPADGAEPAEPADTQE